MNIYTRFNHRPEQKFVMPRKPKIRLITKSGIDEIVEGSSNPVEFEDHYRLPKRNVVIYRSQINLHAKFNQIHEGREENEDDILDQTFYNDPKEHPYILRNHAYPIQYYTEPQQLVLKPKSPVTIKQEEKSETSLFQAAKRRLMNAPSYREFKQIGELCLKHYDDIHPSYQSILNKL